jgi:hypothetical protein
MLRLMSVTSRPKLTLGLAAMLRSLALLGRL